MGRSRYRVSAAPEGLAVSPSIVTAFRLLVVLVVGTARYDNVLAWTRRHQKSQ
jgi:hypothetical protein